MVLPFEKKQWPFGRGVGVDDFADHDGMITAVIALGNFALDIAERRIENRCAVLARMPLQAGKLINSFGRKTTRHIFLIFAEKIYREAVLQVEAGIALRAFVNTDQNQRWIQRQGHESIGREPVWISVLVACGNHGDASGEMAHDTPQLLWFHRHDCSLSRKFLTATRVNLILSIR